MKNIIFLNNFKLINKNKKFILEGILEKILKKMVRLTE